MEKKKIVRLVADKGCKWSYMNGMYIFGNIVYTSLGDVWKYKLIDKDGNVTNENPNDHVTEIV